MAQQYLQRPKHDAFGGIVSDSMGAAFARAPMSARANNAGAWINTTLASAVTTQGANTLTLNSPPALQNGWLLCIDCGSTSIQTATGEDPTGSFEGGCTPSCTTDGVTTKYSFFLKQGSVLPFSEKIHVGTGGTDTLTGDTHCKTTTDPCGWVVGSGFADPSYCSEAVYAAPTGTQTWTTAWCIVRFSSPPAAGLHITVDYQYTPAEICPIANLSGSTVQCPLLNNHSIGAKVGPGMAYVDYLATHGVKNAVIVDPLGYVNMQWGVYQIQADQAIGHNGQYISTTSVNAISCVTYPCVQTVTANTPIGNLSTFKSTKGFVVSLDRGTANSEDAQILDHNTVGCADPTATTFCVSILKPHTTVGFRVEGFDMAGVVCGGALTGSGGANGCNNAGGGGKYGNLNATCLVYATRLRQWGMNFLQTTGGVIAACMKPNNITSGLGIYDTPDHSIPFKLPFMFQAEVEGRGQTNSLGNSLVGGCGAITSNPYFANVTFGFNKAASGMSSSNLYSSNGGISDVYSVNYPAWLCGFIKQNEPTENPWNFTTQINQTDYMKGAGDSSRMGIAYDGIYEDHWGLMLLVSPYHVSVNIPGTYGSPSFGGSQNVALLDNLNHPKDQAVVSYLQSKYGTIANLCAAWDPGNTHNCTTTYDNFGTDGTQVTAVALSPLPDGITKTFTVTLASAPDRGSLQIFDPSGNVIAGDEVQYSGNNYDYWRLMIGFATSSVNGVTTTVLHTPSAPPFSYFCDGTGSGTSKPTCTGANQLAINFSVAPGASASPLTASYWTGGWGVGKGIADEDGRHNSILGCQASNPNCAGTSIAPQQILKDGTTAFQADMAGVMQAYFTKDAAQMAGPSSPMRTLAPHQIATSQYAMGTRNVVADPVVYQAECPQYDVIGISMHRTWNAIPQDSSLPQVGQQDLIDKYCGKPTVAWTGTFANQDSELFTDSAPAYQPDTHAAMGTLYHRDAYEDCGHVGQFTGKVQCIGWHIWEWQNLYGANPKQAWGMVDFADNPQDGVHNCNVNGTATEKIGNTTYTSLPSLGCYGDSIDPMYDGVIRRENSLLGIVQQSSGASGKVTASGKGVLQ